MGGEERAEQLLEIIKGGDKTHADKKKKLDALGDIGSLAREGHDISFAVDALNNVMSNLYFDENDDYEMAAISIISSALLYHYIWKNDFDKILELSMSGVMEIQAEIPRCLGVVAEKGADIYDAVVIFHFFSTINIPTQPDVTKMFRENIEEVMAKHCSSTERWDETQRKIEKEYEDWLKKKEHTGKSTETSMLIQFIAERKAKIAKDKGVLSVGTVKPPDEKKRRKYKTIKRDRNG